MNRRSPLLGRMAGRKGATLGGSACISASFNVTSRIGPSDSLTCRIAREGPFERGTQDAAITAATSPDPGLQVTVCRPALTTWHSNYETSQGHKVAWPMHQQLRWHWWMAIQLLWKTAMRPYVPTETRLLARCTWQMFYTSATQDSLYA